MLGVIICHCTPPLSTASRDWKIRWNEERLQSKEKFLHQEQPDSEERPPNIVLILVDDLGKFEVSAYGSETMQTPNIDRIGAEGARFSDCYVTSPVCSPSRAGILTGRHQTRFGFETQPMEYYPNNLAVYWLGKNMVNTDNWIITAPPRFPSEWEIRKQGLPPTEITLAELLKSRGYHTAAIGKWHLGLSREHLPRQRGFDYQYGFYGAFSLYTPSRRVDSIVHHIQPTYSSRHQWKSGRKGAGAIRRNGKVIREKEYLTFALRDEAIRYIESHQDRPFFLYLTFNAPHVPFQAPRSYYDRYAHIADENKRVYYAMIHALDDAVGSVHQRIVDLGLEENTIIYFLSDNGGASYTKATDNGPYKGGKLTMFEGGVNVPFFMKWKGKIPAGTTYAPPVSALDIFTTSAAAAGSLLPQDRTYDGLDLLPFLTGQQVQPQQRTFFWKADHIEAMRQGDWKFLRSTRDQWTDLYHIGTDRYEQHNLYSNEPHKLNELLRNYNEWKQQQPAPLWPRLMDHLFIIDGQRYLFPA